MSTLPSLRPKQKEILDHLWQGKDCIGILPTGYGKSLCYLFPAAEWNWKVWVVSPLVSLMEDQVLSARALGISCLAWSHGMGKQERLFGMNQLLEGRVSINFITPERLVEWEYRGILSALLLSQGAPHLIVLDEMHCLEEWRTFRPAYQNIFSALQKIKSTGAKMLGLTATMRITESVDWMREFCRKVEIISVGLGRENIHLRIVPVVDEKDRWHWIFSLAQSMGEENTVLLYASSRREVEEVYRTLKMAGLDCHFFHAGISAEQKSKTLADFRQGKASCLVATSAFGMGIDYSRVRRVVHLNLPYSIESYWQEVGRAGRDGLPSEAILLWRRSEVNRLFSLSKSQKEKFYQLWMFLFKSGCRKQALARFFHMQEIKCNNCDACESSARKKMQNFNRHIAKVWWIQPESEPEKWLERKFLEASENS